jgi:hypothetical protein
MSEPDNPRWLDDVGAELRREVPVRAAWRARLLEDVASAPRPGVDDRVDDDPALDTDVPQRASRRIVLSPLAGIAAAIVFAALGAGAAVATISWRSGSVETTIADAPGSSAAGASTALVANGSAERETVRFELAAPSASRVALVGSFNEWNPVATPLERDPASGKWIVSLRLAPGRHVYAFVVDGDVTADPSAPRAADDDFGSAKSVLLVSGKTS